MKKVLLGLLFFAVVGIQMDARDVFVYNGMTPVKSVKNVRKISFATGVMNLTQEDGTVNPVNLSDFNNFSFRNKSRYTLGDVNADAIINVGDLTALVSMIMGDYSTKDDTFRAADINADETLNVGDLTELVSMIMNAVK